MISKETLNSEFSNKIIFVSRLITVSSGELKTSRVFFHRKFHIRDFKCDGNINRFSAASVHFCYCSLVNLLRPASVDLLFWWFQVLVNIGVSYSWCWLLLVLVISGVGLSWCWLFLVLATPFAGYFCCW